MKRCTMRQFLTDHPDRVFKHRTRRQMDTREMTNFYSASLDADVVFDEERGELSFWSPCAAIMSVPDEARR